MIGESNSLIKQHMSQIQHVLELEKEKEYSILAFYN